MAFNEIRLEHKPRQAQHMMRDFFAGNVKNGKKFSLIDSPVGTGKSFGAVMMMDHYHRNVNSSATFDVLTNSKILQEQYTRDFDFMHSLQGKGNYTCETHSTDCGTGRVIANAMKAKCEDCPYAAAKDSFFANQVALTNFHLFITYKVHVPEAWAQHRKSRVLIVDEAHEFDAVFCDFITNKLSKFVLKRCGLSETEASKLALKFSKFDSVERYAQGVEDELLPMLMRRAKDIQADIRDANEDEAKKHVQLLEGVNRHIVSWSTFLAEFADMPENWVLEASDEVGNSRNNHETIVQPVWAYPYLNKYVWGAYDHVILMSGTILDKTLFCFMNGLRPEDTEYLSVPSPFPKENRPIYYFPVGKMNYANKEETYAKQAPFIRRILQKHAADKGIIHTFSYENMNRVVNSIPDARLLHHESATRNAVLERHVATKDPTVLVSPSMMTGIDLSEDLSRFQVIMKVPYPNLRSEKVKRRMATNKNWYSWMTVCGIIQSYGRSIRSETDTAQTYVLDACFGDILKWSGHLLPQYVKDAIHTVNV